MKPNKTNRVSSDQRLLAGVRKHFGKKGSKLVIDGREYSGADLAKVLEGRIEATTHVEASKAAWQNDVAKEQKQMEETDKIVSAVKSTLRIMFASSVGILGDFGLSPTRERTPLTPEEKLAAIEKGLATRKARHIMGRKQRRAIVATSDDAAPPPPAPAPKPSPATSAGPASPVTPGTPVLNGAPPATPGGA